MGLLAHTFFTFATRWVGYLLEGVASVIVARSVGPGGKGTLAILNVLGGLALQMGNLGLHASTVHFSARESHALGRIAWVSLIFAPTMGIVVSSGLGMVLVAFPSLVPHVSRLLIVVTLLGIPFAFLRLFFQNIMLGQQRVLAYNLLEIGGKAVGLPLVLVILLLGGGVPQLVLAGFGLYVITALFAVRLAFRGVAAPFAIDRDLIRRMLSYGSRSYLACVLAYLIIRSDMLLVNYFLGTVHAGVYAVAVNLADLLLVFPTAAGSMLFPRISAVPQDDGSLTASVSRHTAAGMTLLCCAVGALADPLIRLLYGSAFQGASTPFLLLLPGILALSLETVFMNDLAGRGMPPVVIVVPGIGLVLNLILNLLFIPKFGLAAAAISSSVAYAIMLAIAWRAFCRRTATPASACTLLSLADLKGLYARCLAIFLPER